MDFKGRLFTTITTNAQSKKALADSIAQLKAQNSALVTKVQRLNSDCEKVMNTQSMNVNALSILSEKTASLQKQVDQQLLQIRSLLQRYDSITVLLQGQVSPHIVVKPQNEKDSIKYIVQQYFAAETWNDLLPYVLYPERIKKIMESSNGTYFVPHKAAIGEKKLVNKQHLKEGDIFTVTTEENDLDLFLKKVNGEYKVDWEASNKYNEIPPLAFRNTPNITTAEFRVSVSHYDFYWHDYGIIQDKYTSFYLYGLGWYVYVDNSLPCAKELNKLLEDKKIHQLILTLKKESRTKRYDDGTTYTSDFYFVTAVHPSWSKE